MEKKKPSLIPLGIIAGLATLYSFTGGNPSGKSVQEKYALPTEISVVETDLPCYEKKFFSYNHK